jgi:hypothetical protein
MKLLENGYERITDFSIFKNRDLSRIGDFIYIRDNKTSKGRFKSLDLFIYDNCFLDKDDENFGKHTYKNFIKFHEYETFLEYAKPYNQLDFPLIKPNYQLILGFQINIDIFIHSLNYLNLSNIAGYEKITKQFTYGAAALEEALK